MDGCCGYGEGLLGFLKCGEFLDSLGRFNFLGTTLLRGVSYDAGLEKPRRSTASRIGPCGVWFS
jgi:hypothetical protein